MQRVSPHTGTATGGLQHPAQSGAQEPAGTSTRFLDAADPAAERVPPVLPAPSSGPTLFKRRHGLGAAGLLVVLTGVWILWHFDPARYGFYPRCTFHELTGWQCPGCGGLRAVHALLHGRWAESWRHNPLPLLAGPAAVLVCWTWYRQRVAPDSPAGWLWRVLPWFGLGGVLLFGLLRNLI